MSDGTDNSYGVAAGELRSFIERVECVQSEIADKKDDEKQIYAEAKGRGFDVPTIRRVVALRKRNKDDIAESEAILEMYKSALGMV